MQTVMVRGVGLIGSLVVDKLLARGVRVFITSRTPAHFAQRTNLTIIDRSDSTAQIAALKEATAVINLEGKNLARGLWTERNKKEIQTSRKDSVAHLAELMRKVDNPKLKVLQASAVGYYGSRGDTILSEDADPGSGFLADTCVDWESAALKSFKRDNLAVFRIAPVLSNRGGVFPIWRRSFRVFLGARSGDGKQYFSWIHEDDIAEMFIYYLEKFSPGAINATSPEPLTNRLLTEILMEKFSRKAVLHLPKFIAARLPGGFGREMLLASTRAVPKRALADGFEFRFRTFADAAEDLF